MTTETSETSTKTDEWQLPLDQLWAMHRERIDGHPDQVPAMVQAWHKGENGPAWMVWIGETSEKVQPRDAGLHAAKIMATVTGAEYIMFSFDTHMSNRELNPTTGKPWGKGEMQRMCDEEGYCDTGNIRDNLAVAIVRRSDQKILFHSIPYHFHGDGTLQFWDEHDMSEWDENETGTMKGIIPDALREAVSSPPLRELMTEIGIGPDDLGLTEADASEVRLHEVIAGARILSETAKHEGLPQLFVNVIPARNADEAAILEESARRSGLHYEQLSAPPDDPQD